MTAPDTVQCPNTHKVALEKGKCCCKESVVNEKISCLSILTPCSECEDGDENDGGDEKISCLDKFGKETCINHGNYVIYNLTYVKKCKFLSNKLY